MEWYADHIRMHVQYINNLWRVDPSSFAATLNMICMRAPALMQRLMDHEVDAANAAIGQYGNIRSSDAPALNASTDAGSAVVPGQQQPQQQQYPQQQQQQQQMSALQHPHELEVRSKAYESLRCDDFITHLSCTSVERSQDDRPTFRLCGHGQSL